MARESLNVLLALSLGVLAVCPACAAPSSWNLADAGVTPEGGSHGAVGGGGDDGNGVSPPPPPPGDDASSPPGSSGSPGSDGTAPPMGCGPTATRGAAVPYQEYEAESASTNGTV